MAKLTTLNFRLVAQLFPVAAVPSATPYAKARGKVTARDAKRMKNRPESALRHLAGTSPTRHSHGHRPLRHGQKK